MAFLTHRPAAGRITEAFGPRPKPTPTSPATHYGLDYGWGEGLTIVAARTGVVKSVGRAGDYGNRVVLDHGDGIETWYCHLESWSVVVGQTVRGGVALGVMGSTGNVTARHLHFEVRVKGVAVDPAPLFLTVASTGVTPITKEEEEDMPFQIYVNNAAGRWAGGAVVSADLKTIVDNRHIDTERALVPRLGAAMKVDPTEWTNFYKTAGRTAPPIQ